MGLVVSAALVVWILLPSAGRPKRSTEPPAFAQDALPVVTGGSSTGDPAARTTIAAMDPSVREMSVNLNSEETSPEDDLATVQEILDLASRATGGHPSGENGDITAALVGSGEGAFLPKNHPAIRDGELLDRWGTPYWFHPVDRNTTEIRSAGPDRELFTSDDVVLNDSGVGAPN